METLKKLFVTFVSVIAGTTISTASFLSIFGRDVQFSVVLLWQIIGMSVVCTFGNVMYLSKHEISKNQMKLRLIIHYLYINMIVIGGAFLFGWLEPGYIPQLIVILTLIAVVYLGVTILGNQMEEKTAENMNKLLRKMNSSEKEKDE